MVGMRPVATLVTGATGYLGSLAAGKLLAETDARLVLPVRSHHSREAVIAKVVGEALRAGARHSSFEHRLTVVPLPAAEAILELAQELRRVGIHEIVHCAGCVDYFDSKRLSEGNVDLTRGLIRLGQELNVRRFTFISTAFSAGYRADLIRERLHSDADEDPTEYTQSKRQAERLVASSGLPYLIVRPSIVIGDSRDGRYCGKRYGIYQLWAAAEKIMCSQYHPRICAIAPRVGLPLIHQDAFQAGFLAGYRALPDNSVFHLVSRSNSLPTVRDLWDLWLTTCSRPREAFYFDRLEDVPMEKLSRPQQMWIELTAVNLDISCRAWNFESSTLDRMRHDGLKFTDVTLDTIATCQERFIADSPRVRQFMETYKAERMIEPNIFECGGIDFDDRQLVHSGPVS
jgi:nucleoside-diphosphate-sugar epimerase